MSNFRKKFGKFSCSSNEKIKMKRWNFIPTYIIYAHQIGHFVLVGVFFEHSGMLASLVEQFFLFSGDTVNFTERFILGCINLSLKDALLWSQSFVVCVNVFFCNFKERRRILSVRCCCLCHKCSVDSFFSDKMLRSIQKHFWRVVAVVLVSGVEGSLADGEFFSIRQILRSCS